MIQILHKQNSALLAKARKSTHGSSDQISPQQSAGQCKGVRSFYGKISNVEPQFGMLNKIKMSIFTHDLQGSYTLVSWYSVQTAFSLVRYQQLGNSVRGHNPNVLQMLLPNGQPESAVSRHATFLHGAWAVALPTQRQGITRR